jgi:hypothetical protein
MRTDIRRYHLFISPSYYPNGGMGDYKGTYSDLQAAYKPLKAISEELWSDSDTIINLGAETKQGLEWVRWVPRWIRDGDKKIWWWGWEFEDGFFVSMCRCTLPNPQRHFLEYQFEAKIYAD